MINRMKGKKRASITVFMSLMLMVIASLLFTLLEGSRYIMLGMMAVINSQSVTESIFAEYNVPAYQNYHLFLMDSSYGTGELLLSKVNARMQELGQENLNPCVSGFGTYTNFLQMDVMESSVTQYELATDNQANALLKQMSQLMKYEAVTDLIQNMDKKATDIQKSSDQGKKADQYLDGALDTIEQAKETAKEEGADKSAAKQTLGNGKRMGIRKLPKMTSSGLDTETVEIENPMEDVKQAKGSSLLGQILSGEDGISTKKISKGDSIEKRSIHTGNYEDSGSYGMIDKLLIIQYLKKYTSSYRNKVSMPHALDYEQEYILFGKYTDEDNLKKMASRLLLIREGINFAYLMTDSAKRDEALAMATAIATATGIPAASAIQMGILASWAYSESIVELRTLFSGGKISAGKTRESWTVDISEIASVLFHTSIKSKEVSSGLDYEDYLHTFLAMENMDKIGMRFANILEKNIRLYAGNEQLKLDCMITAMEAKHTYQAKQVFLTFVTIERLSKKGYQYEQKYSFSYTKEKMQ